MQRERQLYLLLGLWLVNIKAKLESSRFVSRPGGTTGMVTVTNHKLTHKLIHFNFLLSSPTQNTKDVPQDYFCIVKYSKEKSTESWAMGIKVLIIS